jgi:hypothetical protein
MKTIRQILETLPTELATKAIRAAEMTAPQMMAERATDAAAAIQKGIIWGKTVEGYAFWNAAYTAAK